MKRNRWMLYGVPLVCLLLLAGVWMLGHNGRPAETASPPRLLLLSGAGLRPPVEEIVEAFQRRYGVRVEVQYGPSNILLGQLELTEKGDVFLPGDAYYIAEAARRGFVTSARPVAWFVPAIQVAGGNPKGIETLADLAAPGIRLALADERAAAIGRITPSLFRDHRVPLEAIERNTVFTAVAAPELAQAIAFGHADAAVIWRPVALQYPLTEVVEIPAEQNRISPIEAAVLTTAAQPDLARDFVDFMKGSAARAAFARHHYDPVEEPRP